MTKREKILQDRLRGAHRFIGALMRQAKDYGSEFSAHIHVDCERFLKDNVMPRASTVVVVNKAEYYRARIEYMRLRREAWLQS